jgi:hypothetical protein
MRHSPSLAEWNIKTSKWNYGTNTGHICTSKHGTGRYRWSLSGEKKNTEIEPELGAQLMTSHLLLSERSKLRNDIAGPILATSANLNTDLEGIKYRFKGKKRTPKLSKNWVLKWWYPLPISCWVKHQNFEMTLHGQYWPHLHIETWSRKVWNNAFKEKKDHQNWVRIGC